jgi:tetratricopeptide (TPR) repeat protein
MKTSDKLFQLIKSLTKAEKRYFKLFTSIYGGRKNYLCLFDTIDAYDGSDDERLRELVERDWSPRQLQVTKSYLYDQILRSLRVYHDGATIRAQIRALVQNIEILYEKGLLDQAYRMYESALEMATRHEEHVSVMHILGWGTKIKSEEFISNEAIEDAYRPIYDALDRFRNYLDHLNATVKLGVPTLRDAPRTAGELEVLDQVMAAFPDADAALSVKARILYCWSHAVYHYLRGEHDDCLRYTEMQVALHEEHPGVLEVLPVSYLHARTNQLSQLKRLGRFDEFWPVVDATRAKLEGLMAMNQLWSPRLRAHLFGTLYVNQLSLHLELKERSRYRELARVVEGGLSEHEGYLKPGVAIRFRHCLTLLYLELGDLRSALEHNNCVVQGEIPDAGRGIYYHARLMKLLLHYEMGHTDLLEYLVVSTYRFFRSRNIIHGFEDAVLDFFRRVLRMKGGPGGLLALFEEMRDRLAALAENPLEAEAFNDFNYIGWLDGKIASLKGRGLSDPAARIAA